MSQPENSNRYIYIVRRRRRSPLDKTRRIYLRSMLAGILGIVSIIMLRQCDTTFPMLFCIVYCVTMGVFIGIATWFYRSLGDIPRIMSLSIVQAQKRMIKINRRRAVFCVIGWIACVLVLAPLFWYSAQRDTGVLVGACAGLAIGLPLGIKTDIDKMRHMRTIIAGMEAALRDAESTGEPELAG